ncbi:MAG: hypothetical protein IK120_01395, partial [Muribaculaceae bacterium]|nr:hypothetical protein [Muribaculaceae bacterium]
ADAGNYRLVDLNNKSVVLYDNFGGANATGLTGYGKITPRVITAASISDLSGAAITKTYDHTDTLPGVSADAPRELGSSLFITYDDETKDDVCLFATGIKFNAVDDLAGDDAGTHTLNYTGLSLAGDDAANYSVESTLAGGTGIITKRAITLTLGSNANVDKLYNGTDIAVASDNLSGGYLQYASGSTDANKLVADDGTSFSVTGKYASANVVRTGDGKQTITYTAEIKGDKAKNYNLTSSTFTTKGEISPFALTVSYADVTKAYDGGKTVPTVTPTLISLESVERPSDGLVLTTGKAEFHNENVRGDVTVDGDVKNWVEYSGLALTPALANNYDFYVDNSKVKIIDGATIIKGRGAITPKHISSPNAIVEVNGAANLTKVYDTFSSYDVSKLTDEEKRSLIKFNAGGLVEKDQKNAKITVQNNAKFKNEFGNETSHVDATKATIAVNIGGFGVQAAGAYIIDPENYIFDSGNGAIGTTLTASGDVKGTITPYIIKASLNQTTGL